MHSAWLTQFRSAVLPLSRSPLLLWPLLCCVLRSDSACLSDHAPHSGAVQSGRSEATDETQREADRQRLAETSAHTRTRSHAHAVASVAVDGEFLQSALAGQIMLKEQIPKMLQEERTTVFVTPCIDNWLRLKGSAYSGALHIAQSLAHLKCRHDKGFGQRTTRDGHSEAVGVRGRSLRSLRASDSLLLVRCSLCTQFVPSIACVTWLRTVILIAC